jgi:6-phosphofructokinase 1
MDSIVPMAFGNLALDLILKDNYGRLVALKDGRYDDVPLEVVTATKKVVNVKEFYDVDRYRPRYENFEHKPQFIMTSEG